MLGEKLKELREAKGLLQRQVAAAIDVDTAYVSKVENDEKRVSRLHLANLSKLLHVPEKELLNLWLADKILALVKKEDSAIDAVEIVQKQLKTKRV
jgi:transcriptional regulator with XRE-family HTH domain